MQKNPEIFKITVNSGEAGRFSPRNALCPIDGSPAALPGEPQAKHPAFPRRFSKNSQSRACKNRRSMIYYLVSKQHKEVQ